MAAAVVLVLLYLPGRAEAVPCGCAVHPRPERAERKEHESSSLATGEPLWT
jgi:hypothetical protein